MMLPGLGDALRRFVELRAGNFMQGAWAAA